MCSVERQGCSIVRTCRAVPQQPSKLVPFALTPHAGMDKHTKGFSVHTAGTATPSSLISAVAQSISAVAQSSSPVVPFALHPACLTRT